MTRMTFTKTVNATMITCRRYLGFLFSRIFYNLTFICWYYPIDQVPSITVDLSMMTSKILHKEQFQDGLYELEQFLRPFKSSSSLFSLNNQKLSQPSDAKILQVHRLNFTILSDFRSDGDLVGQRFLAIQPKWINNL